METKYAQKVDLKEINKDNLKKVEKLNNNVNEIDDFLKGYQDSGIVNNISENSTHETPGNENDLLGVKVKKRRGRKKKETFIAGEVINGILFLSIIDLFMPMVIRLLHELLDNKTKITPQQWKRLRLTEAQKKELEPIVDEFVKQFDITANPTVLFLASLAGLYSLNYMTLRAESSLT